MHPKFVVVIETKMIQGELFPTHVKEFTSMVEADREYPGKTILNEAEYFVWKSDLDERFGCQKPKAPVTWWRRLWRRK